MTEMAERSRLCSVIIKVVYILAVHLKHCWLNTNRSRSANSVMDIIINSDMVDCTASLSTTTTPATVTTTAASNTGGNHIPPTIPPDRAPTFNEPAPIASVETTPIEAAAVITQTPTDGSTAPPTEPEETCTTVCVCPCAWVQAQNYTRKQIEEKVLQIQEKLKLDKEDMSATIRRKRSAKDVRTSAISIGYVGLGFLIVAAVAIFILDVNLIVTHLRRLIENIRNVYQN